MDVPLGDWLVTAYDRISILHVATALLLVAVFALALWLGGGTEGRRGVWRRLLLGLALSLAAVAVLGVVFPGFYRSTLATDDPVIQSLVSQVREMQPIRFWTRAGLSDLLIDIGGTLLALPFVPLVLWGAPDGATRRLAVVWTVTLLATLAAALAYLRFVVEFAAPGAIGVAGLMAVAAAALSAVRPVVRVAALLLVALLGTVGLPAIGLQLKASLDKAEGCDAADLSAYLRVTPPVSAPPGGPDPIVMLNNFNLTPRLAYETPFRFVAASYHRGAAAIRDAMVFFMATDDAAAQSILGRREVALVILCRSGMAPQPPEQPPGNLEGRLLSGEGVPAFLAQLPLPERLGRDFVAYTVKR
ncbi:hypothetical protein D3874_09600 [Oleomonas cavernae]|uniref:Uncharacterized protein n=1 Tax=Oleomonas cavernae TaxID=2320859 RepID=A0A418WB26_9PROT|nr:hypothetical protein [Oleomonas cavernae]RJF87253.1 hypothetical protein D3874_09600 [Oleomonas cavernae]